MTHLHSPFKGGTRLNLDESGRRAPFCLRAALGKGTYVLGRRRGKSPRTTAGSSIRGSVALSYCFLHVLGNEENLHV